MTRRRAKNEKVPEKPQLRSDGKPIRKRRKNSIDDLDESRSSRSVCADNFRLMITAEKEVSMKRRRNNDQLQKANATEATKVTAPIPSPSGSLVPEAGSYDELSSNDNSLDAMPMSPILQKHLEAAAPQIEEPTIAAASKIVKPMPASAPTTVASSITRDPPNWTPPPDSVFAPISDTRNIYRSGFADAANNDFSYSELQVIFESSETRTQIRKNIVKKLVESGMTESLRDYIRERMSRRELRECPISELYDACRAKALSIIQPEMHKEAKKQITEWVYQQKKLPPVARENIIAEYQRRTQAFAPIEPIPIVASQAVDESFLQSFVSIDSIRSAFYSDQVPGPSAFVPVARMQEPESIFTAEDASQNVGNHEQTRDPTKSKANSSASERHKQKKSKNASDDSELQQLLKRNSEQEAEIKMLQDKLRIHDEKQKQQLLRRQERERLHFEEQQRQLWEQQPQQQQQQQQVLYANDYQYYEDNAGYYYEAPPSYQYAVQEPAHIVQYSQQMPYDPQQQQQQQQHYYYSSAQQPQTTHYQTGIPYGNNAQMMPQTSHTAQQQQSSQKSGQKPLRASTSALKKSKVQKNSTMMDFMGQGPSRASSSRRKTVTFAEPTVMDAHYAIAAYNRNNMQQNYAPNTSSIRQHSTRARDGKLYKHSFNHFSFETTRKQDQTQQERLTPEYNRVTEEDLLSLSPRLPSPSKMNCSPEPSCVISEQAILECCVSPLITRSETSSDSESVSEVDDVYVRPQYSEEEVLSVLNGIVNEVVLATEKMQEKTPVIEESSTVTCAHTDTVGIIEPEHRSEGPSTNSDYMQPEELSQNHAVDDSAMSKIINDNDVNGQIVQDSIPADEPTEKDVDHDIEMVKETVDEAEQSISEAMESSNLSETRDSGNEESVEIECDLSGNTEREESVEMIVDHTDTISCELLIQAADIPTIQSNQDYCSETSGADTSSIDEDNLEQGTMIQADIRNDADEDRPTTADDSDEEMRPATPSSENVANIEDDTSIVEQKEADSSPATPKQQTVDEPEILPKTEDQKMDDRIEDQTSNDQHDQFSDDEDDQQNDFIDRLEEAARKEDEREFAAEQARLALEKQKEEERLAKELQERLERERLQAEMEEAQKRKKEREELIRRNEEEMARRIWNADESYEDAMASVASQLAEARQRTREQLACLEERPAERSEFYNPLFGVFGSPSYPSDFDLPFTIEEPTHFSNGYPSDNFDGQSGSGL